MRFISLSGLLVVFAGLGLTQQLATPTDFGSTAVGSSSTAQTLTLNLAGAATQPAIYLRYGQDFQAGLASCGNGATSCSLTVTFSPKFPGVRQDAVVVTDGTGSVLATMLVSGTGRGPQVSISPAVIDTLSQQAINPAGLALDASGNLFFSDWTGNVVYELQAGTTTARVIAGHAYQAGYTGDGAAATGASLDEPRGLAVDGLGNLYIADSQNNVVRKVDGLTGTISTVLGGTATATQLSDPTGLVMDASGHLYVSDSRNNVVRELNTQNGTVSTVAGTSAAGYTGDGAPAVNATLDSPAGLALDSFGNLYIADSVNNVIRKVSPAGVISTVAGTGAQATGTTPNGEGGAATSANLSAPNAVAVDAGGNLYIADSQLVRRVDEGSQNIVTVAGSYASNPLMNSPQGAVSTGVPLNPSAVAIGADSSVYLSEFQYILELHEPAGLLDFPVTTPALVSSTSLARVLNSGNAALTFSGLNISEGFLQKASGGVDCSSATILGTGSECEVSIAYAPFTAGQVTGMVTLTDNALNGGDARQQISLSGTGAVDAQLVASTNYLSFGSVAEGASSSPLAVTLTNTGTATTSISGIAITGSNPGGFSETNNCPTQLASSASCQVNVIFSAQAAGGNYAALTISDNALNSPQNIQLSGTSVSTGTVAPGALSFAPRHVGTQSAAQMVTVHNTGTGSLSIYSVSINSGTLSDFGFSNNCQTIASGASCTIGVTFTPSGNGARTGTLTILDSTAGSPHSVALSGIGFGGETSVKIDSPTAQSAPLQGLTKVQVEALAEGNPISNVLIAVDGVPYGAAASCGFTPQNCVSNPNGGLPYVLSLDTTRLANGMHTLDPTVISPGGNATTSVTFTVANWSDTGNPIKLSIDAPGAMSGPLSGNNGIGGWVIADNAAITSVSVAVDGRVLGNAAYGGTRADVCNAYPSRAGCPNVGWNYVLNTSALANGTHILAVTAQTTANETYTETRQFSVAGNPIHIDSDLPGGANSGPFSGRVNFGGWSLDDNEAIAQVKIAIDGIAYGSASYGGARPDACAAFSGRAGCPNVGWNVSVDTSVLSNGGHMLVVTAVSESGESATITMPFTVSNATAESPFTITSISPDARGGSYQGITLFTGCVTAPVNSYLAGVSFNIDGNPVTYSGPNRQGFGASLLSSNNCPSQGLTTSAQAWFVQVDTRVLGNGPHLLEVVAYNGFGLFFSQPPNSIASFPFTVANWSSANPSHVSVDFPNASSGALKGSTNIGGWAFDDNTGIETVQIAVDGVAFGNASYGGDRSDVCAVYPGKTGCPNVGWNYALDTNMLADGTHSLTVTVTNSAGRSTTVTSSFQVANQSGSPIRTGIDFPSAQAAALGGTVNFGGWAIDDNEAIASVTVLVDGVVLGDASYGGLRPDVCAAFPGRSGCPNVGWNFAVDTTVLSNGAHIVEVRVTSASGQHATAGANFSVGN